MVLLLLGFDAWLLRIARGARYDGDFNVAHFGWLDALAPSPSSGLYVGVQLLIGWLSFVLVWVGPRPIALTVLAVLYTYGWAMSQLDSYQHHYLLSWLLVAFALQPRLQVEELIGATDQPEARQDQPRLVSDWAFVLTACTLAIVYGFAAISKTEHDWLEGRVLQRFSGARHALQLLEPSFRWLNIDPKATGTVAAMGTVGVQAVIACGYLLAPWRDRSDSRALRVVWGTAWFAATSFHLAAERLELRIGWFSWYMIVAAAVFFAPVGWLLHVPRIAAILARRVRAYGLRIESRILALILSVALMTVLGAEGSNLDLPGAPAAALAAGLGVTLLTLLAMARGRWEESCLWLVASISACLVMWASIAASSVRYDFYRYAGGDKRARGDVIGAIRAYEKAELYAPAGGSRRKRIEELRLLNATPSPSTP
jgi:hypothetical protein